MEKSEGKKFSYNKITILTVIIIVITLAIGGWGIFRPFLNRGKSLRREILHERDKNIVLGKMAVLDEYLRIYDKRIPKNRNVSWLLGELTEAAKKEGIDIVSITPSDPEDRGIYIKLSVTMEIRSDYNQLGRFISMIESSKKFFRVEKCYITEYHPDSKEETEEGGALKVKSYVVVSTVVFK